ncbi:MAG TPA: hypothetical protein V6D10_25440 [Trichocoleus sp.]
MSVNRDPGMKEEQEHCRRFGIIKQIFRRRKQGILEANTPSLKQKVLLRRPVDWKLLIHSVFTCCSTLCSTLSIAFLLICVVVGYMV